MSTLPSKRLKLLLVDDEKDIVDTFKRGLEKYGISVDAFTNAKQALDRYKTNYYDRIISDIRMPEMNGFDFARAIWAKDPNAQICFFSAFENYREEARMVFTRLKSDCFIQKPITPKALAMHIEEHQDRRKS